MSAYAAPTEFQVRTVRGERAYLVKCTGKLTAEWTPVLKEEVKALLPLTPAVVLDFTEVSHMDSSGLGTVVGLYISGRHVGCELRLINFNQRVRELLGVTRLLSWFEAGT